MTPENLQSAIRTGYERAGFSVYVSVCIWLMFSSYAAASENASSLKTVPERCISLHEGQVCYQKVTLTWQLPVTGNYCLYQELVDTPLQCWQQERAGELEVEFESPRPLTYSLRQQGNDSLMETSTVSVSWVYKSTKRQRRNWRLF